VSIVRWNLKEAAGKSLARRTGIAYEAFMMDKKANIFKVPYLTGMIGRKCSGHKRGGASALPGEVCISALRLPPPRGCGKDVQKSAEGIVCRSCSTRQKARTQSTDRNSNFDEESRSRRIV